MLMLRYQSKTYPIKLSLKTQPAKTAEGRPVLVNPSETIDPTKSDRPK